MYIPQVELHRASTIAQASALLERLGSGACLLAGGTDVLVDLKTHRAPAKHLISLRGVGELRGVSQSDDGVRIGAMTTITELNRSPIIRSHWSPVLDASTRMAAPPIRNVATVGGNVIGAVPCADLPPILMVLGARARVWSPAGERTVPIASLYVGPRQTVLQRGELLVSVEIPAIPCGSGAAYQRFGLREGNAIAVASVGAAVTLDKHNVVCDARLSIGAVAPLSMLVDQAAEALIGQPADESHFEKAAQIAMQAARPICDVRGSAAFRRELVGVLARRALGKAAQRARERNGHQNLNRERSA